MASRRDPSYHILIKNVVSHTNVQCTLFHINAHIDKVRLNINIYTCCLHDREIVQGYTFS